jgi:Cdc6-like AAA superfamily ATPase
MKDEDWNALRLEIETHFTPGTPIRERDLLLGRKEQLEKLVRCARTPGWHATIFGERGVGKSSIGNTFHYFITGDSRNIITVQVRANSHDSFHSLWFNVFKRIRLDNGQRLADQYRDVEITPDDVLLAMQEFNAADRLIIVLDEIDRVRTKKARMLLADTIKALSDEHVEATVVCIGVAESVGQLIEGHESIGRNLRQVEMPRMEGREIRDIVTSRVKRCGILIGQDTLRKLVFVAKGLPYYAHLLGLHACQAACDRRSTYIEPDDLSQGIERALDDVTQTIRDGYDKAIYSDRKETIFKEVLLACALAERDSFGRFTARAVGIQLNKIIPDKNYKVPQFSYHLKEFCDEKRGAVLEQFGSKRSFKYRFREALMEPFAIGQSLTDGIVSDRALKKIMPLQIPDLFAA